MLGSGLVDLFDIYFRTSRANAVGKEAVRAGMHVFKDVVKGQKSLKESLRSHAKDSSRNLRRNKASKFE